MTDREAFEAWVWRVYPENTIYKVLSPSSGYWQTWQAATEVERERCAYQIAVDKLRAELAKPVESDAPIRSYRLTLQLDADTLSDLATALMNLSLRADRGELTRGVSAGPDSGHIYELLHDPTQTHETYFSQVREYLKRKKAKAEGGAA